MHKGAVYIAFGADYYRQCVVSVKYLKHNCPDLPVTVVTDQTEVQGPADAFHIVIPNDVTTNNRMYRTMANRFAFDKEGPYDEWILLDTDVVVGSPRFIDGFDRIGDGDAASLVQAEWNPANGETAASMGATWESFNNYHSLDNDGVGRVYTPGTCFFRSGPKADEFFTRWWWLWDGWAYDRDLPPFTGAVQDVGLQISLLNPLQEHRKHQSYHWVDCNEKKGSAMAGICIHEAAGGGNLLPKIENWRPHD